MKKKVTTRMIVFFIFSSLTLALVFFMVNQTSFGPESVNELPAPDDSPISSSPTAITPPLKIKLSDEKIERLLTFIENKMSNQYGVFSNYLASDETQEASTGHEILSESAGLMMAFAARSQQEELFARETNKMTHTFDNGQVISYRYSPLNDQLFPVNAAVDDLRIIRVLEDGAKIFNNQDWHELSQIYGQRFSQTNLVDDQLVDFYDSDFNNRSHAITLCYIDLSALKLLPITQSQMDDLIKKQESLLKGGYISDQLPLYHTRYNYQTNHYENPNGINIVESLITLLHLVKDNQYKTETIDYLKKQTANGQLVHRYQLDGKVLDRNQSAAAYALTALVAARLGDLTFYQDAINQMEKFQVTDTFSPFYGAFGDLQTQTFFSFDNLLALLAYQANPSV